MAEAGETEKMSFVKCCEISGFIKLSIFLACCVTISFSMWLSSYYGQLTVRTTLLFCASLLQFGDGNIDRTERSD